ncbi:MAG: RNA polymerase sigma factor [Chitinophagales bacterium]
MKEHQINNRRSTKQDNFWIAKIRQGDERAIHAIYKSYRKDFINWLQRKTACSEDNALDIFQETIMVLYENIRHGKLTTVEKGLKPYLAVVGKRIYYAQQRKKKLPQQSIEDLSIEEKNNLSVEFNLYPENDLDDSAQAILQFIKVMKHPCSTILRLAYYDKLSAADIAVKLGYKNANVIRVKKANCLAALRKRVKKTHG